MPIKIKPFTGGSPGFRSRLNTMVRGINSLFPRGGRGIQVNHSDVGTMIQLAPDAVPRVTQIRKSVIITGFANSNHVWTCKDVDSDGNETGEAFNVIAMTAPPVEDITTCLPNFVEGDMIQVENWSSFWYNGSLYENEWVFPQVLIGSCS